MTSATEIGTHWVDGNKSKDPTFPGGKRRATYNAYRHGLSMIAHNNPAFHGEIEQAAKAICPDHSNPALFEQAVIIAECALVLRFVALEKVAMVEQLRDPFATSPTKKNRSLAMARLRSRQTDVAYNEFAHLQDKLLESGELAREVLPRKQLKPGEAPPSYIPLKERDEYEALKVAMPDLTRLRRYERRAWSRLKRAFERLMAILVISRLGICS